MYYKNLPQASISMSALKFIALLNRMLLLDARRISKVPFLGFANDCIVF